MIDAFDIIIMIMVFITLVIQLIIIAMLTSITKFFEFYINEKSRKYVFGDDQKHNEKNDHDGDSLFI